MCLILSVIDNILFMNNVGNIQLFISVHLRLKIINYCTSGMGEQIG
jgi:hypothetical protein